MTFLGENRLTKDKKKARDPSFVPVSGLAKSVRKLLNQLDCAHSRTTI